MLVFSFFLIQNNLPDRTIIQLYSKSTQTYLCVKKSGAVKESGDDKLSKSIYQALHVYHIPMEYSDVIIQLSTV